MGPDLFSIAGKTALITGGTSGIGLMIAEGYLRAGARIIVSSRKADACAAAGEALAEFGEVHAIPADVSREDQCAELIDAVGAHTDRLDILVNNAGATWGAPFDDFPAAAFDKILTLNVKAPFVLTQLARPLLEAMGKNIFHAGAAGAGQTAKICNNMLLGILMAGTADQAVDAVTATALCGLALRPREDLLVVLVFHRIHLGRAKLYGEHSTRAERQSVTQIPTISRAAREPRAASPLAYPATTWAGTRSPRRPWSSSTPSAARVAISGDAHTSATVQPASAWAPSSWYAVTLPPGPRVAHVATAGRSRDSW